MVKELQEKLHYYLPYRIEIEIGPRGETMEGLHHVLGKAEKAIIYWRGDVQDIDVKAIRPRLRPLTSLTKPITVQGYNDGKEFVPVEYFEIGDEGEGANIEYSHGNIKLIHDLETIAKYGVHHDIKYLPFAVVELLFRWHFWIGDQSLFETGDVIKIED